jgi:tetratricopeptide (TPR) repeat protein
MYSTEIASLVGELKKTQRAYWPCVFAVAEQKGMSFSMDLPSRFGLDWNRLTPDFLHMHYRDGFSLNDLFTVSEINYGGEQETLDSWCSLTLRDMEGQGQDAIVMPLPRRWLAGSGKECFYCGLKNHAPAQCPAKVLPAQRDEVWAGLGLFGLDELVQGFKALDETSDPAKFISATTALLSSGKGVEGALVRALFAINSPSQPGLLPMLPRMKQREWPIDFSQLQPEEDFFIRDALTAYLAGDLEGAKEGVRALSEKKGRSFEAACLEGFIALDTGDDHMAQFYWQEAGRIGTATVPQGYVLFLQGRLREIAGEYKEALGLYKQVFMGSSRWSEPTYRAGVCMVKMGFTGQALDSFSELVLREPNFFNRLLIDPEIDRGRVHVLAGLGAPWQDAKSQAEETGKRVEALLLELPEWFDEDHAFRKPAQDHLERMWGLASKENYVAFRELVRGMSGFYQEMQKQIDEEIKRIKERVTLYAQRLRDIQYEAGWFPFPKMLHDFNADFNFCVQRINWTMTQQLRKAANFRTARRNLPELEERLVGLAKKLVSLRIIRDSTLFAMILGKNFIWLEVVGMVLALLTLPVLLYYSSKMPQNWIVDGILAQKWAFQKGLMFVVTIFSLGLASLISVTTFEKKKKQLFETDAERRAEMKRIAEAKNKLDGKQPQRAAPKTAASAPAKGAAPASPKGPAKK